MTETFDFLAVDVAQDELRIEYYDGGPAYRFGFGPYAVRTPEIVDPPHLMRASGRHDQGLCRISVERHLILRYTACGVWIDTWQGERYVNLRANKQWASTTEAEAIDQLWHRKRSEIRILTGRLDSAQGVRQAMEKHLGKTDPVPRPRRQYDYDEYY